MAGTRVASLYAEITADTKGFTKGAQQVKTDLGNLGKQAGTTMTSLGNLYKAAAGSAAILALGKAFKFSIDQAAEQERIMAATESVIKATGGAAGLSARQIADMAGQMSRLTSIDDEVIQGGQNMLLTFKNIGQDAFPRATQAMMDMAVAMNNGSTVGLDLTGTAIQLGKALNSPLEGMTALTRVGVTFSAEQKKAIAAMMELGDVAGAQAIILAELESEFGGAAEAAGGTFTGSLEKAKNAVGNLGAQIGESLLPTLQPVVDGFTEWVDANAAFNILLDAGIVKQDFWTGNAVTMGGVMLENADILKLYNQYLEDHLKWLKGIDAANESWDANHRRNNTASESAPLSVWDAEGNNINAAVTSASLLNNLLQNMPAIVETMVRIKQEGAVPVFPPSGKMYEYFVVINQQTVGATGIRGDQAQKVAGKDYIAQAGGGPLADVALVGDPGPNAELIVDGYVFPAETTRHLLASGLFRNSNVRRFAAGGSLNTPLLDGVVGTSGVQAGITNTDYGMGTGFTTGSGSTGGGGMSGAGGGGGGKRGDTSGGSTSASLAAAAVAAASAATAAQQVAATSISAQQQANAQMTEQMTASITASFESSSQQVTAAIDALRNDMRVFTEALPTEIGAAVQLGA